MKSWDQYNDISKGFFEIYVNISSEFIFSDVIDYMPSAGAVCLDVGAGSGRDSAFLARRGCRVTAVEPSMLLREKGIEFHKALDIDWVDDHLPELKNIKSSDGFYDFILISAVWMHLTSDERQEALNSAFYLLKPKGKMILTLRLGPAEPDRMIYKISTEEAIKKAELSGFNVEYINPVKKDGFNRAEVYWQILVLAKG